VRGKKGHVDTTEQNTQGEEIDVRQQGHLDNSRFATSIGAQDERQRGCERNCLRGGLSERSSRGSEPAPPAHRAHGAPVQAKHPKKTFIVRLLACRGWHTQREHASAFCRPALAQGRSSVCLGWRAYQWWSSFPGCATPAARNSHAEPRTEPRCVSLAYRVSLFSLLCLSHRFASNLEKHIWCHESEART